MAGTRRLHLILRIDRRNRVTATFRRLWGEYGDAHPVIRIMLDQPPGTDWWYSMSCLTVQYHEVPVPEDFETMTGAERYEFLRGVVMDLYAARRAMPDRHKEGARKQPRRV